MIRLVPAFSLILAATLMGAPPYREIDVPDGGTIQGKVLWKSERPVPQVIPVNKDQQTCGESKTVPAATIGKNGEVGNAVVYLEGIAAGKKMASLQKVQLDQKNCEYVPHVLIVPPNAEVEILNSDPMLHNVHTYKVADPRPTTIFNLAFPLKGQKVTKKLSETGKIVSLCDAGHPWMSAHIVVAEHPYYAISNAEGNFVLENVPPGKYTVKLWHQGTPKLQNNSNTQFLTAKPRELIKQVSVSKKQTVTLNFEL
ncbi:carboxypeptidase regulatory-like domain-containing protein [bacterium]|nr:carboxypeptidase regulatory-like domain-containing protein [bacterium]